MDGDDPINDLAAASAVWLGVNGQAVDSVKLCLRVLTRAGADTEDVLAGDEAKQIGVVVDVCHEFMIANRKVKHALIMEGRGAIFKSKCFIRLFECSSDAVALPDGYADFTITSPPYWGLRDYGDPGQEWPAVEFTLALGGVDVPVVVPAMKSALGLGCGASF